MKERISTLAGKVEELEGKRLHEMQTVTENPAQTNPCTNFKSASHLEEHYPMAPSVKDSVTPRFPARPDRRIRTGFRDARLKTGTPYLIFFLKPIWYLWVWPTSYNIFKILYTYN